jgi:hypothetical protein
MSNSNNINDATRSLEQHGYFVCKDFFPLDVVETAREQILAWLKTDLEQRSASQHGDPWYSGEAGTTILTPPTHLMLDAYAKSPALDLMVEKILSDHFSSELLRALVGPGIKLRGYNIQKLTGLPDPRPSEGISANPHEWHRDSLGEMGIGIFLEDVPGPGNGATSVVPGSHYFPYCPRWNTLLGPPYVMKRGKVGWRSFLRWNLFSRLLGKRVVNKSATGIYGNKGDFYFFINDLWHGREPNIHGKEGIKVMIGAFSTHDPFPDEVIPPGAEVLAMLPPRLREAASQLPPGTEDVSGTILRRLRVRRANAPPPLIFRLVRLERRLADFLSTVAGRLRR